MPDHAEQKLGLTFAQVVAETAATQELVDEWDRLTGYRLRALGRRSPIERMVDESSGFQEAQMREIARDFLRFVYDCVWTRFAA